MADNLYILHLDNGINRKLIGLRKGVSAYARGLVAF
jgi:hypothetical protein